MSNIKKLPTQKLKQKKSSLSPFKPDERCVILNLEEKINKKIELRLGRFVKEIQLIKAKQKKSDARHKGKHAKATIESIGKVKKTKSILKQKIKPRKNNTSHKKPKK